MTMLASVAMLAMAVAAARPAAAESISGKFTRKDEMNAARVGGGVFTLRDLIDRRARAPVRFDRNHRQLGRALSLGIDGLNARRAIAPRRFDFYHPCLAFLLGDTEGPGGGIGGVGRPDTLPEIIVTPPGEAVPLPPAVVPPAVEPPGLTPSGQPDVPPEVPPIQPPPLPQVPTPPGQMPPPPGPGVPPGPGQQQQLPTDVVIPEPPALLQLGVGLAGLVGVLAWRRRLRARPMAPSPAP